MHARNLEEAIEMVNGTGYGLSSGLESLDEREQELWKEKIVAGNLYINKPTTGAIVGRQPFGGMRNSAVGTGIKAGGPNYVRQFMNLETPAEAVDVANTISAYKREADSYFAQEHDPWDIRGEDNDLRYLPVGEVVVRVDDRDSMSDIQLRVGAASAAGNSVILSLCENCDVDMSKISQLDAAEVVHESDTDLIARIDSHGVRVRYAAENRVPEIILEAAAKKGVMIASSKPSNNARHELSVGGYYQEQAISNSFHRYGNLLHRVSE